MTPNHALPSHGVPFFDLKAQYGAIRDEIRAALERVLESQHFILGPEVEALEAAVADYCRCRYAVGVSSGTDAILAALMALDIGRGDEVIVPDFSFFATAGCVARLGARPVFVDIDPASFNLDPAGLSAAVTPRTRAIIPVHLYGQTADMDPILDFAQRNGLAVIEDAAQAIGAEYHGRRAGALGQMGCFSFYPTKNLGAYGDGGLVTTNDPALADRLRLLRGHGARPKYHHALLGGNFRLDEIQAAVLRVKLKYLDGWTEARQHNAERYRRGLAAATRAEALRLPAEAADCRHIYYQFVVRSPRRDALRDHLRSRGIGTEVYYPEPLHVQPCFEQSASAAECPAALAASRESLALPIYPELTDEMQAAVMAAVADFNRDDRFKASPDNQPGAAP